MNLFLDLLPMILGTALAPAWLIIVLLILRGPDGLIRAIAFVAGTTVIRISQWLIFGQILGSLEVSGGDPAAALSILLMVLGILLLISAVKSLMAEDELDAPPPRWMTQIDEATPLTVFGFGMLITLVAPKLWVFTLSAIGVIRKTNLTPSQGWTTYLLYLVGAQFVMVMPLVITAIAPRQSNRILQSLSNWLIKNKSQISLIVSFVFGVLFLWKGISGLIA